MLRESFKRITYLCASSLGRILGIIALLFVLVFCLASQGVRAYSTPAGYNENDYQKLVAYLELPNGAGKNGDKISASYNPEDPTTWAGVGWNGGAEKRVLAVVYSSNVPTLHYARKAALLAGCDVLSIEYSDKVGYDPEVLTTVAEESYQVVATAMQNGYVQLFYISKSIGHSITFRVDERFTNANLDIRHICYTPLAVHVADIKKRKCLVLTGTRDKWFSKEDIQEIKDLGDVELVAVENAVHSLEIDDDYHASLKILEKITDACAGYIQKFIAQ